MVDYPVGLATRIGFLLARAHLIAREEADRALGEVGLTAKGYAALATVVGEAPISQQKLSRRLRMDPATMVDVIDELDRSGYVLRRRNPNDRREYALVTSGKGRTLFSRATKALNAAERETIRDLNADETSTLRATSEMEKNALGAGG